MVVQYNVATLRSRIGDQNRREASDTTCGRRRYRQGRRRRKWLPNLDRKKSDVPIHNMKCIAGQRGGGKLENEASGRNFLGPPKEPVESRMNA